MCRRRFDLGVFFGHIGKRPPTEKTPMALKDLEIKYAARRSKEYKLFDGDGLYVLVKPSGSKLWRYKYRFDGKE
ncbi:Arm DNA-binding domain-containing protein, partial [Sphingopyxis sp.]|uniref:Arm DNA-binding domain-containing protein n=1 Tax=Sphingopyxis sp. TaxID=1908224 RepID=UPI002EDAB498